jgi:hypothetical protein
MPAFRRRRKDAGTVGRIVFGYGDLELMLAICLGMVIARKRTKAAAGHSEILQQRTRYEKLGLKIMFRIRGAELRAKKVKKWCKPAFVKPIFYSSSGVT